MDDFRVKIGWRNHPKRRLLKRRLGSDAVLALFDLWEFCAESRTDGDLSGMDAEAIAAAADYGGDAAEWVEALIDLGLLDGCAPHCSVHQWALHNPWVAGAHERSENARKAAERRWAIQGKNRGKKTTKSHTEKCQENNEVMRIDAEGNADRCGSQCSVSDAVTVSDSDSDAVTESVSVTDSSPSHNAKRRGVSLSIFEEQIAKAGIAVLLSSGERERYSKLLCVDQHEISYALDRAAKARQKPNRAGWVLAVIESEREKAAKEAARPDIPPKQQPQNDCWHNYEYLTPPEKRRKT